MLLREKIIAQGNSLFRRRGTYSFILAVPLLALVFQEYRSPEDGQLFGLILKMVCLGVSLTGLALRVYTRGCGTRRTSGRNTQKGQVADTLNTTGIYSLVRNPLYLGNFLAALGAVMFLFLWWLIVIYVLAFWIYYERIILAEEEFLHNKFGEAYFQWTEKTPVFIPALRNWCPPALSFSWRTALKAEYQTISLIVMAFTILQIVSRLSSGHNIMAEPVWIYLLALTLIFFVVVRFLRKHTSLLRVTGR